MFDERTAGGLDVHARSISTAAIGVVTGELFRQKLAPDASCDYEGVAKWLGAARTLGNGEQFSP